MKNWLRGSIAIAAGVLWFAAPAHAIPLIADGISYSLQMQSTANPLTERFALVISGENLATDTEGGGRTGIHSIALSDFNVGAASGSMVATLFNNVVTGIPTGYSFQTGGLNSDGCNGTGNFFCFQAPTSPPGSLLTGQIVMVFDVTLGAGGSWANYATSAPHLKIDWTGSQNNYDLVSAEIGVSTTCPDCKPTPFGDPVPEPASMALLGAGLLGLGAVLRRRRS